MTPTEPRHQSQLRPTFSAWLGVVLLFAIFGLFVLVIIGASPRGDTYEERRAKTRIEKLQALREESAKALTTYGWVDKSKGVVRIPVDEAMKLTMAELARKSPVPANPIAEASPAGSPSAPGAAVAKAGANPSSTPGNSPGPGGGPAGSPVPGGGFPSSGAPKVAMSPSASPALSPTSTASGKTP